MNRTTDNWERPVLNWCASAHLMNVNIAALHICKFIGGFVTADNIAAAKAHPEIATRLTPAAIAAADASVRGEFLLGIFPPDHGGNHAPPPPPAAPAK